jgi:hypothetical protein
MLPPASHKRRRKGNPAPGGKLSYPVPGVYKYGNLALHVGGVSDERRIYDYGYCATLTSE